jgi:hypothetical protein
MNNPSQISNTCAEAFTALLDVYEHIGETLPLLLQYQNLFRAEPHMVTVLSLIYEDILKFHRLALRYFQLPLWRQIFSMSWANYKSRFTSIIHNLAEHRKLVESQANLTQIEEYQKERRLEEERFNKEIGDEERRRLHAVVNWLKPTDVEADQTRFREIRADYPTTGCWLLRDQRFLDWFDPQYPVIPPLLWLSGIPGAGMSSQILDRSDRSRKNDSSLHGGGRSSNACGKADGFILLLQT